MPRIVSHDNTAENAPKATPRATKAKADSPPDELRRPHTPDEKKLAAAIGTGYQTIGAGITAIGMRIQDNGIIASGTKTIEVAEGVADAWIELSRRNPAVKAYLKKITEVSAVGMVVGMHVVIILPFLADRGVIPAQVADMAADMASPSETEPFDFEAAMNDV